MNVTILERFDLFKETFNVFGTFILKKSDEEIEYLVFEEFITDKEVYKAKDIDEFEEKIKQILENKLPKLADNGYKKAKKKEEIKEEEDTDFQQANKAPVLQHAQVENIKTTEDVL